MDLIIDLAPVGTCPNALTKKVLTCKCEEILRDTPITFPLAPRLSRMGVVLTIPPKMTLNSFSERVFHFIRMR
ncbi:hypothetical protein JHK87_039751 [Glycine soja]|nr:hypothetical protein JHK87_039751 [Glycine soja]